MSNQSSQSRNSQNPSKDEGEKVFWRVRLNVDPAVKKIVLAEALETDRHYSWVLSRALERLYVQEQPIGDK